jgi:hypothetical protein
MALVSRFNGAAASGAFYGYQPLCIRVQDSNNNFTANSTSNGVITEGGYEKMVRAVQSLGSIVILGAQANGSFCCVVDAATFNNSGDAANTGAFGVLKTLATAVSLSIGGSAPTITVTTSTASPALTSAGAFTLA